MCCCGDMIPRTAVSSANMNPDLTSHSANVSQPTASMSQHANIKPRATSGISQKKRNADALTPQNGSVCIDLTRLGYSVYLLGSLWGTTGTEAGDCATTVAGLGADGFKPVSGVRYSQS